MKVSLALLILLLAAACTDIKAASFRSAITRCCSKEMLARSKEMLVRMKIPSSRIKEYQYTSSSCALEAALVKLPNVTVCVRSKEQWFQEYLSTQKPNTIST